VPIRSILAWLDATGFDRQVTLVYWARDPSWLVHDDEFRALARRGPAFAYHPVAGAGDGAGILAETVERLVADVSDLVAYVCGGGRAIDAVRAVLMAKGLERKAVKWEKFW
jgi:ferredoxin-NADP reductase